MPERLAVGVDVGSTHVKAALVDLAGAAPPRVAVAPTPAGADALVAVVERLLREVTADGARPGAVGVASMAESGVPLDLGRRPLTDLLRWDGARGGGQAAELRRDLGAEALLAATGVRLAPKTPLATWRWLAAEHPAVLARTARWAGAADLVVLALTGRLVTDHTLAGRTGAYRLPGPGEALPVAFDPELLAVAGLAPHVLPVVARPGAAAGTVTQAAAGRTGLPAGVPVVVAGHDHAVGAWACGVRTPGRAADSLGTAEAVLTVLAPGRRPPPAALLAAGMSLARTVSGDHDAVVAGFPTAGSLLARWAAARGGAGLAPAPGRDPTGLLVLPYPQGRTCPAPDPEARLRLLDEAGQAHPGWPPADRAALWDRALLEGLALHARWMLDAQAGLAGAPVGGLTVVGGAAGALAPWVRAKADATPTGVRATSAAEPVATGAALLAAARTGLGSGAAALPSAVVPRGGALDAVLDRFVEAALERPQE